MTQKISQIFVNVLTCSSLWLFLLLWNILDSSNYELSLFIGNAALAAFFIFIILLITNRISFSLLVVFAIHSILVFASNIKAEFFASQLTYSDIKFLLNLSRFSGKDFILSYLTVSFTIYTILITIMVVYLYSKTPKIVKGTIYKRATMILCALLSFKCFVQYLRTDDNYVRNWIAQQREKTIANCNAEYNKNSLDNVVCKGLGTFLDFAYGVADHTIRGVQTELDSSLIKKLASTEYQPYNKMDRFPNIILILNESTFNPTYLDYNFARAFDKSFFENITFSKGHGSLKVHTFGGSSSLSEFPSVTGITYELFEGPVTYPFINLASVTKSSIFRELKKVGYYTVVIYPQDKKFINADNAFKILGADKIVGTDDYNLRPDNWTDVSEEFISKMIDSEIEKAPKGMPVFLSVATIRNHGPHKWNLEDKIGCKEDLGRIACSKLNDYIGRLEQTKQDWLNYTNKIMHSENKTLIIQFGDHLPSFEGEMFDLKFKYPDTSENDIFRTFYTITANFEMPKFAYDVLDIIYLPSIILDAIGANNSEFYKAASLMREKNHGMFHLINSEQVAESFKTLMIEQVAD